MQKTSIEEKVKSLEEAVERYADVLREDREGTREMRRAALVAFCNKTPGGATPARIEGHFGDNWTAIEEWLQGNRGSAPNLASLRATKPAEVVVIACRASAVQFHRGDHWCYRRHPALDFGLGSGLQAVPFANQRRSFQHERLLNDSVPAVQ